MAMQLPGALALAAAGAATHANAATVQMTFTGSYISTSGGNHLVTDFGGDGLAELTGARSASGHSVRVSPLGAGTGGRAPFAFAYRSVSSGYFYGVAKLGGGNMALLGGTASLSRLIPLTLIDSNIRGGAATFGWLDVTATGQAYGESGRVDIKRWIFDDATGGAIAGLSASSRPAAFPTYTPSAGSPSTPPAVPEPSSLGLLALGAGGLLARRRRAMAA
jgi:hypothetical protein